MAKAKNEVVENIRSLARVFQSVIDLAEQLGEVGSIEQATAEARTALVKAQGDLSGVQTELGMARAEALRVTQAAKDTAASAKTQASEKLMNAESEAAAIRNAARAEAASIAESNRKSLMETSRQRADLEASIQAAQQTLEDTHSKIERAKAKMAEMLGA